jgi:hypothetical protein
MFSCRRKVEGPAAMFPVACSSGISGGGIALQRNAGKAWLVATRTAENAIADAHLPAVFDSPDGVFTHDLASAIGNAVGLFNLQTPSVARVGPIDRRAQAEVPSALRSDTPKQFGRSGPDTPTRFQRRWRLLERLPVAVRGPDGPGSCLPCSPVAPPAAPGTGAGRRGALKESGAHPQHFGGHCRD